MKDTRLKDGPDIARIGSLIGDPARANMLTALMSGKALTASELAAEAGVSPSTASAHLGKLEAAALVSQRRQGRHRYFALADDDVGGLLEALMGLAARRGHTRTRTGPREPALRRARVCYNHLAGELGVQLYDSLRNRNFLVVADDGIGLSPDGREFIATLGIDLAPLEGGRRPLCKTCLDWSARRPHLAGALGSALLDRFQALGWAARQEGSRVVAFSKAGETRFAESFPP
ncbi:ArsR/SmtB family transcription factor [Oceanibacterium hippocampi]|uniref:HTH arsR-type domain-containing protein n=1 Tax=Oceanibacterium hippocampi TaxID=745714 RepID=A0A1Y5SPR0_9PROT|nr:helix-turn-helix domain-containing protein [Oceanibacterium hippocampi]SLN42517.1 hypothetical protein OCH7691_01790 [Oceanibacterium hippocampi]